MNYLKIKFKIEKTLDKNNLILQQQLGRDRDDYNTSSDPLLYSMTNIVYHNLLC
jgi:hypothetical protein